MDFLPPWMAYQCTSPTRCREFGKITVSQGSSRLYAVKIEQASLLMIYSTLMFSSLHTTVLSSWEYVENDFGGVAN